MDQQPNKPPKDLMSVDLPASVQLLHILRQAV